MVCPTGRSCRVCKSPLTLGTNWRQSLATDHQYICVPCCRVQRGAHKKARPDLNRAKQSRREARKLNAMPTWSSRADLAAVESFRWAWAALMGVDESDVHLDHIVPLKASEFRDGKLVQIASGLHVASNLEFKFARDNFAKGCRFKESELDAPPTYDLVI